MATHKQDQWGHIFIADNQNCLRCNVPKWANGATYVCAPGKHFEESEAIAMPHTAHNYIERNGTGISYGDKVYVEFDKLMPLMSDKQAYKLDLSTLELIKVDQGVEFLPFFLEATLSAELLSYHNWRNRIIYCDVNCVSSFARLHRISYNEFAWVELQPIDVHDFKVKYGGMRNPYEWEQMLGLRVRPEMLKAMGMPRANDETSNQVANGMRPITLNQFFDAV